MNPEIKAKWVSALRSGEYKQGQGRLNDGQGRFCCLGVLCDLAVKAGISDVEVDFKGSVTYGGGSAYGGGLAFPPPSIVKWAGLPTEDPIIVGIGALTYLNDDGCSFEEIAALIEEGL